MKRIFNILASLCLILPHMATPTIAQDVPKEVQRIIDIRDREFEKINERYVEGLVRLKESYTREGDLEKALMVKSLISAVKMDEVVGAWVFEFDGLPRDWTFNSNGTVVGVPALGGKPFRPTWKREGEAIIIIFKSREWGKFYPNLVGKSKIVTHAGRVMFGKKKL